MTRAHQPLSVGQSGCFAGASRAQTDDVAERPPSPFLLTPSAFEDNDGLYSTQSGLSLDEVGEDRWYVSTVPKVDQEFGLGASEAFFCSLEPITHLFLVLAQPVLQMEPGQLVCAKRAVPGCHRLAYQQGRFGAGMRVGPTDRAHALGWRAERRASPQSPADAPSVWLESTSSAS